VTGAVIVTTPQDIALLDARKALKMFEKVGVAVLGIVENISTYICPQCRHEASVFGQGGGDAMAEQYDLDLLAHSRHSDTRGRGQRQAHGGHGARIRLGANLPRDRQKSRSEAVAAGEGLFGKDAQDRGRESVIRWPAIATPKADQPANAG
jgi:Mrp family chromosome partitioning ATPase